MTPISDIDAALANLRSAFAECEAAGLLVRAMNKNGAMWLGVRDVRVQWRSGHAVFEHDSIAALNRELAEQAT